MEADRNNPTSQTQQIPHNAIQDSNAEGTAMAKKPGLDGRYRDLDGEIRQKNSSTRIDTLRKTYGDEFARGYRGDMKLGTLLDNAGAKSLTEYLKRK